MFEIDILTSTTSRTNCTTYHIYLYPDYINLDIASYRAYLSATTLELLHTRPSPCDVSGGGDADRLSLAWSPSGIGSEWEMSLRANTIIVTTPAHTFTGTSFSIYYYIIQLRSVCDFSDTSLSVTDTFPNQRYRVTARTDYPVFGSVTGNDMYYYGVMAILTATPNTNYNFTGWNDGIVSNPRNLFVTDDTTH